ncbi:MAG: hypothetical protein KA341_16335 [Saprospiraceae bacterium]|nr:hypothetical protein [Saprospiraceae bacterium]
MQQKLYLLLLIPLLISCDPKKGEEGLTGKFRFNDTISVSRAIEHQNNYDAFLESIKVNRDSLANNGWVSLDDIEHYIALAKDFAKKNNKDLSGFRIYNAKHPKDMLGGHLTFFISPTGKENIKTGWFDGPEGVGPVNDPDLQLSPLNYINAGQPPRKVYPEEEEEE